tara:strand:- start:145 stop:273 length:129 start_codon:yes stop_codon:yes gene_type:complete
MDKLDLDFTYEQLMQWKQSDCVHLALQQQEIIKKLNPDNFEL